MEVPLFFRCPISMELMRDPVTISTGVTYERKNIQKWFSSYNKTTCPATMQLLESFDLTPNHTLKRLILSWEHQEYSQSSSSSSPSPASSPFRSHRDEMASLLSTLQSTPFKVSALKKLRAFLEAGGEDVKDEFSKLGGIKVLGTIVSQILIEKNDFAVFRGCEEAMGLLHHLPLSDEGSAQLLSSTECVKSMAIMLQRGSSEARFHTVNILRKAAKNDVRWIEILTNGDQEIDIFKSLLELLSDEVSTKAGSAALSVLIEIANKSRKNQLKSIESGAVCVLIELLPESARPRCEKMMFLLKLLCERPEGRQALVDHGMGIAVISKKILRVSEVATKLGVKILWLLCSFLPRDGILEEMLVLGTVKKLLGLLHINGRCSTKEKAMKIIKMYGNISWRNCPCFPCELREYLRFMNAPRQEVIL